MFTHVMVGAHDLAASKKFYDAVLGAIGLPAGQADPKGRIFYRTKTGVFGITKPIDGQPATHANGGTIGFACASPEQARAFHDAGVANGGKSIEDPPGWREGATGKFYLPTFGIHRATRFARCIAAECEAREARLSSPGRQSISGAVWVNRDTLRMSAQCPFFIRATESPYRGKRRNGPEPEISVGSRCTAN
jgi:catechol 2,3-dioxygenase-like lactoylglutathione lyase family enzyme